MPLPPPAEPWVNHLARLPRSLDRDMRRIAAVEGRSFAELERMWLKAMVTMYDANLEVLRGEG